MRDILCILMGLLDVSAGVILLFVSSNMFFSAIGFLLLVKGAISFF